MGLPVLERGALRRARLEDLREQVYALLSLIPPGKVTTYGSIARCLATSPRLVGRILRENPEPLVVPCHRVVKSDGSLGGYSRGGPRVKRMLLELEGVEFDREGRVRPGSVVDLCSVLLGEPLISPLEGPRRSRVVR